MNRKPRPRAAPKTVPSSSTTCSTPSCGNSTRATPRLKAPCSGSSAICTPTSTATGNSSNSLLDAKIQNAEAVSRKIRYAFTEFPNWKRSENALRELRKKVTFAIFAETEDLDRVTAMVDELFTLLEKADRI